MKNENEKRDPQLQEGSDKWGLIVMLMFLIGLPILGVLYSIFIAKPNQ
jgi:hypothetical protein